MENNKNFYRGKRLRTNALRYALNTPLINLTGLIQPLFVLEETSLKKKTSVEISSMPGIFQHTLGNLFQEIEDCMRLGVKNFILFGIPQHKDEIGSSSLGKNAVVPNAIRQIKKRYPNLLLISDICLCEYTTHGHCGILRENKQIDNDKTTVQLAKQAVLHAEAGSDVIAPSAMCDGMVEFIRNKLNHESHEEIPILSYAVKYASAFYGPFREAANSMPQFGSRHNYQITHNSPTSTAISEALADLQEGADILMVKPAMPYLDVLHTLSTHPQINVPLAAYQVSGEYAMLHAAAQNGWLDLNETVLESLSAINRAGANLIISYFTKHVASFYNKHTT